MTPVPSSSTPRSWLNLMMEALEAAYAVLKGIPWEPLVLAREMMVPDFWAFMPGRTARMKEAVPRTLVSKTRHQSVSSEEVSWSKRLKRVMPALATRMSI